MAVTLATNRINTGDSCYGLLQLLAGYGTAQGQAMPGHEAPPKRTFSADNEIANHQADSKTLLRCVQHLGVNWVWFAISKFGGSQKES
jgi:hypothetical protein